jgi:hypothetical protein
MFNDMLVDDLNYEIVNFINVNELMKLFVINTNMEHYMNNYIKYKIKNLYHDFIIPLSIYNNNLLCYKLYLMLINMNKTKCHLNLLSYAVDNDYIDIIVWLVNNKQYIFDLGANCLAKYGKLKELQSIGFTRPNLTGAYDALINKYYDVVYWLIDNITLYPDLHKLITNKNFFELNIIIKYDIRIVKNIINTPSLLSICNYDILQLLKLLPNEKYIKLFIEANNLDGIIWCIENNILPDRRLNSYIIKTGSMIIYNWLYNNNYIDYVNIKQSDLDSGLHKACYCNNMENAESLLKLGAKINLNLNYDMICISKTEIFNLFIKYNSIILNTDSADNAIKHLNTNTCLLLDYLKQYNILPTDLIIENLLKTKYITEEYKKYKINILIWCLKNNMFTYIINKYNIFFLE